MGLGPVVLRGMTGIGAVMNVVFVVDRPMRVLFGIESSALAPAAAAAFMADGGRCPRRTGHIRTRIGHCLSRGFRQEAAGINSNEREISMINRRDSR
jgi:hypothetical protein